MSIWLISGLRVSLLLSFLGFFFVFINISPNEYIQGFLYKTYQRVNCCIKGYVHLQPTRKC